MNWPAVDPIVEAGPDSPARRAQRANRAAGSVNQDYQRMEDGAAAALMTRLQTLKASLQQRLAQEFLTDFKRNSLDSMLSSVDQLIATASKGVADDTKTAVDKAADLGDSNAIMPMTAAQLKPTAGMPKADVPLVQAAFGNLVDLLTPPMQQFGQQVKQSIRRVALATDGRQGEINKLRDLIQGKGFDNAAYKAERIIRTELGRTFNEATYARMVELSKQFPFMRKCWRCTKDSRTRIGHVQAAITYAKGQGIPIPERFKLNVYDEREGKAPKLMGVATLRFPIDPLVQPEGRIGAAATIMCRCNAFVDFNMADFAAYTKQQVTLALGTTTPPPPALPPAPAPAPPVVRAKPPRAPRQPKLKVPKVPKPTVAVGTPVSKATAPVSTSKTGPSGTKVSAALQMQLIGKEAARVQRALDLIDQVHGDGALPSIPVTDMPKAFRSKASAGYIHERGGTARQLAFTKKVLAAGSKNMVTVHEVGHFLDHHGLGARGRFASEGSMAADGTPLANDAHKAMLDLQKAMRDSQVYQTLDKWNKANLPNSGYKTGDGVVPNDYRMRPVVNYLMSSKETFARAYAQYIAVKTQDPEMMKELRMTQASSLQAVQGVPADMKQASTPMVTGKPIPAGTWAYPWAWQDNDFKPIEQAFDRLFEVVGWRKNP